MIIALVKKFLIFRDVNSIVIISLFTKLLWPGGSEEAFLSSSQAVTCLVPTCLPHTMEASQLTLFLKRIPLEIGFIEEMRTT